MAQGEDEGHRRATLLTSSRSALQLRCDKTQSLVPNASCMGAGRGLVHGTGTIISVRASGTLLFACRPQVLGRWWDVGFALHGGSGF
eukprot:880137-Rhodomonas_salina.2